jgi:hypothetical protein
MTQINLTEEQVINLSKEKMAEYLTQHPDFEKLKEEFDGGFYCIYIINGQTAVHLFNTVGGCFETYVSNPFDVIANIFAIKCRLFVKDMTSKI